jgi:ADP-ribose pyrophosphatase
MNDGDLKWKTLSSEYVFEDKWLKARKDICEKPDGKIVDPYYVIEYMHWATAVCLLDDENVVMIKQYRHALGQVCLELPGGCVEDGEAHEAGVKREVLEETGYEFEEAIYLGDTSPNPSTNNNLLHMFLLRSGKNTHQQSLDANEDIRVEIIPLKELVEKLWKNEIISSMHVTNILLALKHLGKISYEL